MKRLAAKRLVEASAKTTTEALAKLQVLKRHLTAAEEPNQGTNRRNTTDLFNCHGGQSQSIF